MKLNISDNPVELGKTAGKQAAGLIRQAIAAKGSCNMIMATGTSQFETLSQLLREKDIDWSKVSLFHLDEYLDLPITHGASFRKYLKERFVDKIPALKDVHLIDGEKDPQEECDRLGEIISRHPIDVALIGIGENGHLAFNDPPANFDTEEPFIVVELDDVCRNQQLGEGWFPDFDAVPERAITMSIKQILKSKEIICSVPDKRKAPAVKDCLEGEITNLHPASILQNHADCVIYLDKDSASLLVNQESKP